VIHLIPAHQGRPADDPIFALNREAMARRAKGESIVNATLGTLLDDEGKLVVLPSTARAVKEVPDELWASYAPIAGDPDFLRAVMDDFLSPAPELRACGVAQATPGGSGALRHAIANYLELGQSLLTTSYFWGPYQTLADEADRKLVTFSMFTKDGALDVAALDGALTLQIEKEGRALLFLNDPCQNPTGYSMRPSEWDAVVKSLLLQADRAPVTLLVAWSASKTFTHYGLRVGALIACVPDAKERAMTEAALSYSSRGTWSNCSHGGLRAVTRLLTDPELAQACDREREVYKNLLLARVDAFNALAPARGLRYPRYEGGFFVTVFSDDAKTKSARMREAGVYVVPTGGALRVGLCSVATRDIPKLVDALA
jgi:aromatic-amino-acid transaminase